MTIAADEITLERTGPKGRHVLRRDGAEAELTFTSAGATLRILDHTGVPETMRGLGVGRALVERAVADARAEGLRLMPLCPFAADEFARRPDWADVRA